MNNSLITLNFGFNNKEGVNQDEVFFEVGKKG